MSDGVENAAEPVTVPPVQANVLHSMNTSTVAPDLDQLSSPTAKIILEEKNSDPSHTQSPSSSSTQVKRTLFGQKGSEPCAKLLLESVTKVCDVAANTCVPAAPPHESSSREHPHGNGKAFASESAGESPVKRSRNKEKEC